MDLQTILLDYKNKHQLSGSELAQRLGVNKSAVSKWLSGDVKKVKVDTLERINQLVGYDIEPILKGQTIEFTKPILGYVKAGYDLFGEQEYLGYAQVTVEENRQGDFFLRVVGDSMIGDGIMEGDLALIQQCSDVPNHTIALVSIANEEITIKHVNKKTDMLILEASNPKVPARVFTAKEVEELPVRIMGRVLYSKTIF